jgi:sulfur carrier protein ThiS
VVRKRAAADREVVAAWALLEVGTNAERAAVAREFDAVHTVERARDVGTIGAIVTATGLREELARRIGG